MAFCPACSVHVPDETEQCPTCGAAIEVTPTAEPEAPQRPKLDLDKLQKALDQSLAPTYEVLRPLGQGGMGAVFLAKEPALKRLVAVKVLAPDLAKDTAARARFEREATAAAALSHPNVVRVYAVGETKRTRLPYIVMQYVEGPTLKEWHLRKRKISEREARRIIGEVAAALAAAHERDLVHRDVKPSNILIEASTGRAFVADFGLTAALRMLEDDTKITESGTLLGTPTYMSPEQSRGAEVTPLSDVYSLGIVAYQLFTGALPYSANSAMGWIAAHLEEVPTPTGARRPELSPAVTQMVDRCLNKIPEKRPTALDVARGMLPTLDSLIEWPPPGLRWLLGRGRSLGRVAMSAVLGTALATAALTFIPTLSSPLGLESADIKVFAWQAALILGLGTFILAVVTLAAGGARTIDRVIRQRRLGWRFATLYDVMVDYDGRSGSILAGSGDFASFGEMRRRTILWARRATNALVFAGSLWIVAVFCVRALSIAFGLAETRVQGGVVTTFDVVFILVPGALLLFLGFVFRSWEYWLLGRLGRPHSYDADPHDVAGWYASLPADETDANAPAPLHGAWLATWWLRAAQLGLAAVTLFVAYAMVASGLATFSAAKFPERFGPRSVEVTRALADIDETDPLRTARAVWGAHLPRRSSVTVQDATAYAAQLISADSANPEQYELAVFQMLAHQGATNVFRRALSDDIPADSLGLLRRLDNHRRTQTYRNVARARRVDVNRAFLGGPISEAGIEIWSRATGQPFVEAARANELTAILAAATGDVGTAYARIGENAAIGELLLDAPDFTGTNHIAIEILQNHVLIPLRQLDEARGRTTEAVHVRESENRFDALRALWLRHDGIAAFATAPDDLDRFRRAVQDRRLPPAFRLEWLYHGWQGLCANPLEILLGPTQTRRDALVAIAASLSDVPDATTFVDFSGRVWERPFAVNDHEAASVWSSLLAFKPFGAIGRVMRCGTIG